MSFQIYHITNVCVSELAKFCIIMYCSIIYNPHDLMPLLTSNEI